MNFSPFGGPFPGSLPVHQFPAKFNHDGTTSTTNTTPTHTVTQNDIATTPRYHSSPGPNHFPNQHHSPVNVPVNVGKYSRGEAPTSESNNGSVSQTSMMNQVANSTKYTNVHYTVNVPVSYAQQTQQQSQAPASPSLQVADYLSHLPASTLPISLHHFLKYSAESIKKESEGNAAPTTTSPGVQAVSGAQTSVINMNAHHNNGVMSPNGHDQQVQQLQTVQQMQVQQHEQHHDQAGQVVIINPALKKKKKKKAKEKKPRPKPGEIRLTTALDGSTLYCCPECHMAYPEKELLEQHLLGHTLERRFVCNICGAGLKRKDHLTRHKQSHNPERPFVCTVCLKAFKRKEQLTLHFVIHSGEKRHVCTECGKGFYRKDHLRKHTRSHIARRVKAEMSQNNPPAPAPGLVLTLQHGAPQHVQAEHQQQMIS
ncbi:Gastrula zinc finger protein XlCGF46.1 [Frankliniella fusca]|uniref:Gastrula zinc finger protein XlCGF46.1 n=1 Tax=Frankliniella fusca TaxID=407009 RepID=A0AAE1HZ67_9NEOP|nr:Gastrula zinc finger protein XlCGF46.1 [Frankliniella fusca]